MHGSPPYQLEDYVQDIRRCRGDGEPFMALLNYTNLHRSTSAAVRAYAADEVTCRRKLLYKKFLFFNDAGQSSKESASCDNCDKLVM